MTFDERVHAVEQKGLTARQARFLTTVMLHAGVCVPRQYARFCGIVYGAKTRKFFDKLVRLRYASMYDCRHNRARIYHVNQRALYAAIGEAEMSSPILFSASRSNVLPALMTVIVPSRAVIYTLPSAYSGDAR